MFNDVALTDAVLAIVAGREGFRLLSQPNPPSDSGDGGDRAAGAGTVGVGLLLVALAAFFGALRFTVAPDLVGTHQGVTRLASLVGLPLVGVGYVTAVFLPQYARAARPYAFVMLIVLAVAFIGTPVYGTVMGGLGMVAVIVAAGSLLREDPAAAALGIVGALGVIGSGLLVNGPGTLGPLTRVAWFHLGLAASAWAMAAGLRRVLGQGHS